MRGFSSKSYKSSKIFIIRFKVEFGVATFDQPLCNSGIPGNSRGLLAKLWLWVLIRDLHIREASTGLKLYLGHLTESTNWTTFGHFFACQWSDCQNSIPWWNIYHSKWDEKHLIKSMSSKKSIRKWFPIQRWHRSNYHYRWQNGYMYIIWLSFEDLPLYFNIPSPQYANIPKLLFNGSNKSTSSTLCGIFQHK